MPEWFMKELKKSRLRWLEQKAATAKWESEKDYVFHAGSGKPHYYSYLSQWWKKFTERHDIRPLSLHKLRHTSVTILIEKGAAMKSLQARVGHKQMQTTTDIYAHVTKKLSRETVNLFDDLNPAHRQG